MYLVSAGRNLYQVRTYVMFRQWTHTSDDSYIYQLSLVVATATASLIYVGRWRQDFFRTIRTWNKSTLTRVCYATANTKPTLPLLVMNQ